MKLIEHLEYIIGLVERSASQAEIKSALLGMREEVEGYEQAASNQVALTREKASVDAESATLKAEIRRLRAELEELKTEEVRNYRGFEFRRGKRTGNQWVASCPVCHLMADTTQAMPKCPDSKCLWKPFLSIKQLQDLASEL